MISVVEGKGEAMSDYIKREDVIDIIEEVCPIYKNEYRYILKDKIADLPSADVVERKRGAWILKPDEVLDIDFYACSECEYEPYRKMDISNFCPNCGADMRGE